MLIRIPGDLSWFLYFGFQLRTETRCSCLIWRFYVRITSRFIHTVCRIQFLVATGKVEVPHFLFPVWSLSAPLGHLHSWSNCIVSLNYQQLVGPCFASLFCYISCLWLEKVLCIIQSKLPILRSLMRNLSYSSKSFLPCD